MQHTGAIEIGDSIETHAGSRDGIPPSSVSSRGLTLSSIVLQPSDTLSLLSPSDALLPTEDIVLLVPLTKEPSSWMLSPISRLAFITVALYSVVLLRLTRSGDAPI